MIRCDRTDWLEFADTEVRCDREAERAITIRAPWGTETFKLCDGHVIAMLDEFPGLAVVSNDPLAPATISALRGE